ncbi:MAG: MFS transporter [Pikeienuella sp.]
MEFFRPNARWLGAGALMALSSGFGQTFFISIYAGEFRAEFGLSDGEWGLIYMVATLCSAAVLTQTGKLSDFMRARTLAIIVLTAFALVCIGVALTPVWWALIPLIFGLRFCGQGMLSHLAVTSMAKWFRAGRAKAVATASLGFSAAEAALPALALVMIGWVGWRMSWLFAAGALILVIAPLLWWLLRAERSPRAMAEETASAGMAGRHWTRGEMLRGWLFWALLPGLVGPSWIGTVIFFQIVHLTEVKGWDIIAYAGLAYPVYSATTILSSFAFGAVADRIGIIRLLPVYLLGWAAACGVLSLAGDLSGGVLALAIAGIGSGGVTVVGGALLAELYGTRWLGGIRAISAAVMVLGSAVGPGVSGMLLDAGVAFDTQLWGMGGYLISVSLLFIWVSLRARLLLAAPQEVV